MDFVDCFEDLVDNFEFWSSAKPPSVDFVYIFGIWSSATPQNPDFVDSFEDSEPRGAAIRKPIQKLPFPGYI